MSTYVKKYKCPFCDNRYPRADLARHIDKSHDDMIPQGQSPLQVAFDSVNKKTEPHGTCMMCGGDTDWNENKGRYESLCGKKKCHDDYVKMVETRLKKARGVTKKEMLSNPEFQNKMLKGRSISGTYTFTDGGKIDYVGSFEKNFLEFLDKVLNVQSIDIQAPGPTIKYMYDGKEHFWITDYMYIPYNLVFDIKDGGSNPNNREMKSYREKQVAKEKAIEKQGKYNYCRLTDNDFSQLFSIMMELKESLIELDVPGNIKDIKPVIRINESANVINHRIYFVSEQNMNNKTLFPKIPNNYFTQNGYEDNTTKRVCFAPTIDKCLMGLSQNIQGKKFYVHIPYDNQNLDIYKPNKQEVPDSAITDEIWVKNKVKIKCIGRISIIKDDGKPGYKFTYLDKSAELYGWEWEWINKYVSESELNESYESTQADGTVMESNYNMNAYTKYMTTGDYDSYLKVYYERNRYRGNETCHLPMSPEYLPSNIDIKYIESVVTNRCEKLYHNYWKNGGSYGRDYPFKFFSLVNDFDKYEKLVLSIIPSYPFKAITKTAGVYQYNFSKEKPRYSVLIFVERDEVKKIICMPKNDIDSWIDVKFNPKDIIKEASEIQTRNDFVDSLIYSQWAIQENRLQDTIRQGIVYSNAKTNKVLLSDKKVQLYCGHTHRYDVLNPVSPNFGNALEKPKMSFFCWMSYDKAVRWAVFRTIQQIKSTRPLFRAYYEANSESTVMSNKSYDILMDYIKKHKMVAYVHVISVDISDIGLGNDSSHDEYTVYHPVTVDRVDNIPIAESNVNDFIKVVSSDDIEEFKRSGWKNINNRGLVSCLMVNEYGYQLMTNRDILTALYPDGKSLESTADIEEILNSKGLKFNKLMPLKRLGYEIKKHVPSSELKLVKENTTKLDIDPVSEICNSVIDIIEEGANYSSKNKYPVYILLMHSGSTLANIIQNVTHDTFSHACIAFNAALDPFYSFGTKVFKKFDNGLTIQNTQNEFWKHLKSYYNVYVMYVTKEQIDKMKKRLDWFVEHEKKLKYGLADLVAVAMKIPTEFRKKWFCSRFVMEIIGQGIKLDKVPSLWRPQEIAELDNITLVNSGMDLLHYNPKITENNEKLIKQGKANQIQVQDISVNESYANLFDEYDIVEKGYGVRGTDGQYNAIVELKGKDGLRYRGRSEVLIIKDDSVFIARFDKQKYPDKHYELPGGGWDENESHADAATREAKEEALIVCKNIQYAGHYIKEKSEVQDWVKQKIPKDYWWKGSYNELYVAEYDSKYTGHVDNIDKQKDVADGQFYKIAEVFDKLTPEHQTALIFAGKTSVLQITQ